MHIYETVAPIWQEQKKRYTLNTLMPMVGLENGSGNEDQREQINKARESLMIRGYEIKSWMAGWKGRKEGRKYIREYIGEWWRMVEFPPLQFSEVCEGFVLILL